MRYLGAIFFAVLASAGNAMFAASQKKAASMTNPFLAVAAASVVCAIIMIPAVPLFGKENYALAFKNNWPWFIMGGCALFITDMAFNLLYTRYGASQYVLYAVISIVTTSLIVGALIFRERLTGFHWAAVGTAIATVILFSIGQARLK
ncbi:EamA family transporter [Lentisphaerota bacterium ZTH]|nr:EamA family transporter [Lentisphaerota bacterium]WET07081.1 EamA family transporter [Lentisphaerota bacterium ZTH]